MHNSKRIEPQHAFHVCRPWTCSPRREKAHQCVEIAWPPARPECAVIGGLSTAAVWHVLWYINAFHTDGFLGCAAVSAKCIYSIMTRPNMPHADVAYMYVGLGPCRVEEENAHSPLSFAKKIRFMFFMLVFQHVHCQKQHTGKVCVACTEPLSENMSRHVRKIKHAGWIDWCCYVCLNVRPHAHCLCCKYALDLWCGFPPGQSVSDILVLMSTLGDHTCSICEQDSDLVACIVVFTALWRYRNPIQIAPGRCGGFAHIGSAKHLRMAWVLRHCELSFSWLDLAFGILVGDCCNTPFDCSWYGFLPGLLASSIVTVVKNL